MITGRIGGQTAWVAGACSFAPPEREGREGREHARDGQPVCECGSPSLGAWERCAVEAAGRKGEDDRMGEAGLGRGKRIDSREGREGHAVRCLAPSSHGRPWRAGLQCEQRAPLPPPRRLHVVFGPQPAGPRPCLSPSQTQSQGVRVSGDRPRAGGWLSLHRSIGAPVAASVPAAAAHNLRQACLRASDGGRRCWERVYIWLAASLLRQDALHKLAYHAGLGIRSCIIHLPHRCHTDCWLLPARPRWTSPVKIADCCVASTKAASLASRVDVPVVVVVLVLVLVLVLAVAALLLCLSFRQWQPSGLCHLQAPPA
ncbi:hypothetical protein Q7P37_006776 [Cladosporium fusiforme]